MKKTLVALYVLACPALASAQTITGIGAPAVRAGDDFATRAFQDPWDMSQRTDLGWWIYGVDQPVSGLGNPAFNGVEFTATTTNANPNVFLLDTANPNAAKIGRIGTNFPIDANTFKYIAFRMSVVTPNNAQFIWNRDTIYDATTTTAFNVATTAGYRIYLVDLTTLSTVGAAPIPWSGLIRALRMNLTFAPAGEAIRIDWVRLVNVGTTASCRTITFTGATTVDLYVTDLAGNNLGKIATSVSANQASPGCTATPAGYTYYAGALAPGTYRVGISAPGLSAPATVTAAGTNWIVNDIPTLTFTSPDPEGSSDDFATTFLNNPWDMNALSDLDLITNISSPQIIPFPLETPAGVSLGSPQVFKGTSVSAAASGTPVGDPYVDPLFVTKRGFNNRIDTNRYRILTFEMGIPDHARDIVNGSIARIVWRVAGQAGENVSDDIIFNSRAGANVLDKIVVDMKDRTVLPLEAGSPSDWINGTTANPGLDIFRVDPHEFSSPTDLYIRRIKLAALEKAANTYTIRWQYSDTQAGTVTLFFNTTNTGACSSGTQIGSPVAASAGQATWTVGPTAVADGTYFICASFTDGTNSNETYAKWPIVVLHSFTNTPRLVLDRANLNFGIIQRPNASFPLVATSPQVVHVSVVGGGTPCWVVDNNLPATYTVTINGTGCGNGSFTISLNPSNPFNVAGIGEATLTVREATAGTTSNSPQSVHSVHRIVTSTGPPIGVVDTPANGATVSGSIAVTGWAVDDIDITTVTVFRDAVAGEAPGLVFIGNASRVDDARPDIEATFPDTPFNYRGGWGYLLLTNFLPNGGDGAFALRIFANDRDGRQTLLGSAVINGNNSSTTRPFGAIDTPGQGDVISGSSFNNFGWVLVRGQAKASPGFGTPGASVNVVIDGAIVGQPCCWASRGDLDALFPAATYSGVSKALGVFTFNPSALLNGVHTIAWIVTADNGQADGIGSRFFSVTGGAGLTLSGAELARNTVTAPHMLSHGPDLGRRANEVGVLAASGPRGVLATELGRVVVDASRAGTSRYDAYFVANGQLRALPVGASFDQSRGMLYWQPGAGYTGTYDFLVVRDGLERLPVRVVIRPQKPRVPLRRGFDITFATEPADASAARGSLMRSTTGR